MFSGSRREFLGQLGLVASSGFFRDRFSFDLRATRMMSAAPTAAGLRSVDAGNIRVSPGPWKTLPKMVPGVHLENLRLRMPDGVHLNAFLYLPEDLSGQKIPAVLKTTPYRNTPEADSFYARGGYGSIFVDVRGSGGSEGIPSDEYSPEEYEDTTHVIDWLSKQPWSNGNVGMYGTSYSAFNSVQIATEVKPPALKAIFAMAGTDDRYTDDIHYPGGAMLMVDNSWALGMLLSNVLPGAPDFDFNSKASLDRWNTPPWLQLFLHNQLDGPHWRRGSVAPDYRRLKVPAFLVGGYLDIYQNFVPRIMKYSSDAVTKGILGTWDHSQRDPGPKIDWDAMHMRWFDHWLKGKDTGMLKQPRVSFYLPSWRRQSFRYAGDIPGEWRHLNEWPDTMFEPKERFYLRPDPELEPNEALAMSPVPGQGGKLAGMSGPASALKLRYYPGTGGSDESFGPTDTEGYYGIDHRGEDPWGLCFDTAPLREPVEILGFVRARLFVSSTAPVANWIVRLHDVAADGTSYKVGRGYLNGTHRRSHTHPEPLVPGEVYEIVVEMMCTGYRFDPGHRMRVVVTNADFPVLWPSPYAMITTLYTGGDRPSHIELPVLPKLQYLSSPPFPAPQEVSAPRRPRERRRSANGKEESWFQVHRDYEGEETTAIINLPGNEITCRVKDENPATASMRVVGSDVYKTDDNRRIEVKSEGALSTTVDEFILNMSVTLLENDKIIRTREWKDRIRRELV